MENLFEEIKEFICDEVGVKKTILRRDTLIYKDLRVDGDDAFELFKSFERRFNVDMSDFDFNAHYSSEGIELFGAMVGIITRALKKNKTVLQDVSLHDLEKSAMRGKWIEPK